MAVFGEQGKNELLETVEILVNEYGIHSIIRWLGEIIAYLIDNSDLRV